MLRTPVSVIFISALVTALSLARPLTNADMGVHGPTQGLIPNSSDIGPRGVSPSSLSEVFHKQGFGRFP
jgi:hypothetical protein